MDRHSFAFASRQICCFVELIKLIENYQNVGNEESIEDWVYAAVRLERSDAVEQNERELHLKVEQRTHCKCFA